MARKNEGNINKKIAYVNDIEGEREKRENLYWKDVVGRVKTIQQQQQQ